VCVHWYQGATGIAYAYGKALSTLATATVAKFGGDYSRQIRRLSLKTATIVAVSGFYSRHVCGQDLKMQLHFGGLALAHMHLRNSN